MAPDRESVGRDLLMDSLHLTPMHVYAFVHFSGSREYDISFRIPAFLDLFWTRYERVKDTPLWQDYEVIKISQDTIRKITILFRTEVVQDNVESTLELPTESPVASATELETSLGNMECGSKKKENPDMPQENKQGLPLVEPVKDADGFLVPAPVPAELSVSPADEEGKGNVLSVAALFGDGASASEGPPTSEIDTTASEDVSDTEQSGLGWTTNDSASSVLEEKGKSRGQRGRRGVTDWALEVEVEQPTVSSVRVLRPKNPTLADVPWDQIKKKKKGKNTAKAGEQDQEKSGTSGKGEIAAQGSIMVAPKKYTPSGSWYSYAPRFDSLRR
nr:PREDICTED: uncharacterized protein LOC106706931 [Latimeria chalumnae]|eukprot:XP_014354042.1 PREDICTED: uncharacterized protein LOC106706931 [Latimeria chalumnae]